MRLPKPSPRAWAVVLAWTALAVVFTPQAVLLNLGRPEPLPHWVAAARSAQIFLLWALFTPLVFAALRRWPPSRRTAGVHVAIGLGLVALHFAILVASLLPQLDEPVPLPRLVEAVAVSVLATDILMCAALYAGAFALVHFDARRRAEQALGEARLAALRAQLQPHFLFNTLNALAELLHRDPPLAETLLLRLSALLRRALDGADTALIPLGEELAFLDDYLSIQQALLGERLRIERAIEPAALAVLVPPLLLQPLVENALRHGIAPRRTPGLLRLEARRQGDGLTMSIENDLPPRGGSAGGTGIGLRNTRERLSAQFGDAASLQVSADGERYRVELVLPGVAT